MSSESLAAGMYRGGSLSSAVTITQDIPGRSISYLNLPIEMILQALAYLNITETAAMSAVCKFNRRAVFSVPGLKTIMRTTLPPSCYSDHMYRIFCQAITAENMVELAIDQSVKKIQQYQILHYFYLYLLFHSIIFYFYIHLNYIL